MQTLLESTILSFTAMLALSATLIMNAQPANADTVDILNTSLVSRSATGFYGLDESGNPIPDRAGIMLVFDYPIVLDSVSTDDFWVQTDDGAYADVIEIQVCDNFVFLKLANELVPSATPAVGMNDNEYVEFDVGNSVERLFFTEIDIHDGIPPTLAMSLSGGSGTGTGDEGPDRLTKDKIHITVTSDEPLDSPPLVTVVCNNIQWTGPVDADVSQLGFDNFIANRSGQLTEPQSSNPDSLNDQSPDHSCGNDQNIALTTHPMIVNSATSWTYEWRNQTESPHKLSDGLLTAIAHARDQSEYQHHYTGETIYNWSAASAGFTLDTILKSPLEPGGGDVDPTNGSETHDRIHQLIIWFQFNEPSTVVLNSIEFDDSDAIEHFTPHNEYFGPPHDNAWFWWGRDYADWPEPFKPGLHALTVDASDAAGNSRVFTLTYEVHDSHLASLRRDPFILNLYPGWNAISFPATPMSSSAVGDMFNHSAVQSVFVPSGPNLQNWSAVTQRDGEWRALDPYNFLWPAWPATPLFLYPGIEKRQNQGYWVYSSEFVQLPVRLPWPTIAYIRGDRVVYPVSGWNFVGITAEHRHHQSEVTFGSALTDQNDQPITAATYFNHHVHATGDFKIAYRWDAQTQSFERLRHHDPVEIGEAIWVYYPEPGER